MGKPVVFVIGASGKTGVATVAALAERYADKLEIRAGVRNPDKLKAPAGVTVVQATMGDKENLKIILKGVDALYIVTPGTKDREQLVSDTAEAAKEAGVKHLLVVSVVAAHLTNTIYGSQFGQIEDDIEQLGVPYTILRLPYFLENLWGFKSTIVDQEAITFPSDPDKPLSSIAIEDAGVASAVILADPAKHAGKTYNLVSDSQTFGDFARAFSKYLGKEIKYVRVPYDAAKQELIGAGFPEWQINAFFEWLKLIDNDAPETNITDLSDYENITGEKGTTYSDWIAKNAPGFK